MALIKVIGYTMAEKKKYKKTSATMASPSQVSRASKKGTVQAGKPKAAGSSKAATITRQMQNKGVKEGTVRLGKAGRSYNVYDEKTGTWKRAVAAKKTEDKKEPPKKTGGAKYPRSGGSGKEGGLARRPTNLKPGQGAEYVVGLPRGGRDIILKDETKRARMIPPGFVRNKPGGGGKQRWDGTKWVAYGRGGGKGPSITRVSKKDR